MTKTKKGLASEILANLVVHGMQEKKANRITMLDLRKTPNAFCDFFVICSATSDKQIEAIAESIDKEVYLAINEDPTSKEGNAKNGWVLMDYFNVIVHVFLEDKRQKVALEELWGDADITEIEETENK